jgi:hypothetical protein
MKHQICLRLKLIKLLGQPVQTRHLLIFVAHKLNAYSFATLGNKFSKLLFKFYGYYSGTANVLSKIVLYYL